jgi:hypothetical protein
VNWSLPQQKAKLRRLSTVARQGDNSNW